MASGHATGTLPLSWAPSVGGRARRATGPPRRRTIPGATARPRPSRQQLDPTAFRRPRGAPNRGKLPECRSGGGARVQRRAVGPPRRLRYNAAAILGSSSDPGRERTAPNRGAGRRGRRSRSVSLHCAVRRESPPHVRRPAPPGHRGGGNRTAVVRRRRNRRTAFRRQSNAPNGGAWPRTRFALLGGRRPALAPRRGATAAAGNQQLRFDHVPSQSNARLAAHAVAGSNLAPRTAPTQEAEQSFRGYSPRAPRG